MLPGLFVVPNRSISRPLGLGARQGNSRPRCGHVASRARLRSGDTPSTTSLRVGWLAGRLRAVTSAERLRAAPGNKKLLFLRVRRAAGRVRSNVKNRRPGVRVGRSAVAGTEGWGSGLEGSIPILGCLRCETTPVGESQCCSLGLGADFRHPPECGRIPRPGIRSHDASVGSMPSVQSQLSPWW